MSEESVEIDQELAKRLLVEGGTLVILDVPIGTDIGIDIKSWQSGEDFKGIKMIPPGFHFVHYRLRFPLIGLENQFQVSH